MKNLLAILILGSSAWSCSQTAVVNEGITYQPIDGFGASSAFAGLIPSSVLNTMYSPSGIGLRYIRVNLVPDYADCIAFYGTGNCVKVHFGATISRDDLANTQTAVANGAVLWATEWSPPGSMKSNGSYLTGGSFMGNQTNYAALAAAQASFVTLMTEAYAIPVYAISVQNEPNVSTKYPSCTWKSKQFSEYVPYLYRALVAGGHLETKIMIAEPGHWNYNYMQTTMDDPLVAPLVGIVAAHAYVGGKPSNIPSFLPDEYHYAINARQHIWETEVSGLHERYNGSMNDGMIYALDIHNWLTIAKVSAWHYWEISGQNYRDNQGLTSPTNQLAKRAFVMANWARFVTGMSEISATANPQPGIYVTAFRNISTGASVIVAVNKNPVSMSQAFTIIGKVGPNHYSLTAYLTDPSDDLVRQPSFDVFGNSFTATLTGSSVTSFVAPTSFHR